MCVHPTKSGAQCRKNPELFLCGTHVLNPKFSLVQGKVTLTDGRLVDLIEIGGVAAIYTTDGEIAELTDGMVSTEHKGTPERKPKGYVLCGACHEYHPSVNFVKKCYLRKRRAS